MEAWLPVAGHEGRYEVSDRGRVRSLARVNRMGRRVPGRIRRCYRDARGYLTLDLWKDNEKQRAYVHRLVCESFNGPQPSEAEFLVRHLDDNPANNDPANLAWGTPQDNTDDLLRNKGHWRRVRSHCLHGHPFSGTNLRIQTKPNGKTRRVCVTCVRDRNVAAWRRERERRSNAEASA